MFVVDVLLIIILLVILFFVLKLLLPDTDIDLSSLARWAVVTGATDGIGKAFTDEIAKKGFNIFLVSRNQEKLDATAKEIREKYDVLTKTFRVDFSEVNKKVNAELRDELQHLEVGLLVNNVGMVYPHPLFFHELEENHEEAYEQLLYVNVMSAVNMTRYVLPGMLKRKSGLIINISSTLSQLPCPLQSIYGATKSFLFKLSRDLDLEYRDRGVHVHVLTTGLVATKLSGADSKNWYPPSVTPEDYVKSAIVSATKKRDSTGHISHTVVLIFGKVMGSWVLGTLFFNWMNGRKELLAQKCPRCNKAPKDD